MSTNLYREGATAAAAAPSPANKPPAVSTLHKRRGRAGLWFVSPWIVGFLLFFMIPMFASLYFSFTDFSLVSGDGMRFVGLENWRRLFTDPQVANSAKVTLKFGLFALPFGMLVPVFIAYLLVSKSLKGKETYRAMFFLPSIIPFVATVLIFGGIMNGQMGWINRFLNIFGITGPSWFLDPFWVYPSLVFVGLWGIGNAMLIFIASMNGVSSTLYDAAKVDGASQARLFWHITLPFISPIIFYNLIILLIGLFNYFLVPFVLNNGSGAPAGATNFYALYFYKVGFQFFEMGYAATLAWALFLVALLVTGIVFWSAKYWVYYEFKGL